MAKDVIKGMRERIAKSGANKKEIFYLPGDTKKRIRFLQEFDTAFLFKFHSHWNRGINALCLEELGQEDCPYCDDDEVMVVEQYAWTIFDYDSNSRKILLWKVNGASPIPSFIENFEEYGTLLDRDFTIKKVGKLRSSTITVLAGDKTPFRNKKAKPYTKKQILEILAKAYGINSEDVDDEEDEDDEVEETKVTKKSKGTAKKTATSKTAGKKKKQTLRDKFEELKPAEVKDIAIEIGMTKKELKDIDNDELLDTLFDDYEEEDLQEIYDGYMSEEEPEDEDEEEDEEE